MKKALSLVLALLLVVSLAACGAGGGGKTKKAFTASKEAYDNVNSAYEIVERFGSDIYEAWRLGIYDDDEILKDGCAYLAKELSLSENELKEGVAYALAEIIDGGWDKASDSDKQLYRDNSQTAFKAFEDSLFSFCVKVVSNAYLANGKTDKIQSLLDTAKTQMKDLSENYSDYEHYPALKGYFTTTSSFFDFCKNPTGSFEQIKTTIETYKTTARNHKADLDYIFE